MSAPCLPRAYTRPMPCSPRVLQPLSASGAGVPPALLGCSPATEGLRARGPGGKRVACPAFWHPTRCATSAPLPRIAYISYNRYYQPCAPHNQWHIVVCVNCLLSIRDLRNLHSHPLIDELKPDGRERSENTARLAERKYRVWSRIRLCPNLNNNLIGPHGETSWPSTRSLCGGRPCGKSSTH